MDWCGPGGNLTRLHRRIFGHVPPWEECCCLHDLVYVQGGPREWRPWADALLRDCMKASGHPVMAWIFWAACRLFAGRWWGGR